jgi:hypothetical protein
VAHGRECRPASQYVYFEFIHVSVWD